MKVGLDKIDDGFMKPITQRRKPDSCPHGLSNHKGTLFINTPVQVLHSVSEVTRTGDEKNIERPFPRHPTSHDSSMLAMKGRVARTACKSLRGEESPMEATVSIEAASSRPEADKLRKTRPSFMALMREVSSYSEDIMPNPVLFTQASGSGPH
jgi:hypothetical protein